MSGRKVFNVVCCSIILAGVIVMFLQRVSGDFTDWILPAMGMVIIAGMLVFFIRQPDAKK